MLKHTYQHWYTQYLGLTQSQVVLITVGVVILALLSMLNPNFLKQIITSILRKFWTRTLKRLRFWKKRAGAGIWLGPIFLSDEARLRHMEISGATGTGKTVLLAHLIRADIFKQIGMIIIDPKGDRKFYESIRQACREAGRERDLHLLSATYSGESVRWNPCALGSASELQSKWFQSGVYDNPFYGNACSLALMEAFNWLHEKKIDEPVTLTDLISRLEHQASAKKNDHIEGLFNQLKEFALSEWGPLLCVNKAGVTNTHQPEITLWDIVRKNEILYVDLPTESKVVQSSRVGKLLLQEITLLSGMRKQFPNIQGDRPFAVYVDEFDVFATEAFGTFLNKGRSSNMMIHMAHQTLGDLERVSDSFAKVVVGNCNIHSIFRMDHPDEADFLARFIGTQAIIKKTFQSEDGFKTGRTSNRETEEYRVHPNRIKNLEIGECVLVIKTDKVCEVVRIPRPEMSEPIGASNPSFYGFHSNAGQNTGPRLSGPAPTNPPRSRKRLDQGADEYAGLLCARKEIIAQEEKKK